jgi:hypothetical protein
VVGRHAASRVERARSRTRLHRIDRSPILSAGLAYGPGSAPARGYLLPALIIPATPAGMMSDEAGQPSHGASAPNSQVSDLPLQTRGLEYQTLRAEILQRSDYRNQTLVLASGAAAFVAGFAPKDGAVPIGVVYTSAIVLLCLGVGSWFDAGRAMGKASARVAIVEDEINRAFHPATDGQPEVLEWELSFQERRTLFARLSQGNGWDPRLHRSGSEPGSPRPSAA